MNTQLIINDIPNAAINNGNNKVIKFGALEFDAKIIQGALRNETLYYDLNTGKPIYTNYTFIEFLAYVFLRLKNSPVMQTITALELSKIYALGRLESLQIPLPILVEDIFKYSTYMKGKLFFCTGKACQTILHHCGYQAIRLTSPSDDKKCTIKFKAPEGKSMNFDPMYNQVIVSVSIESLQRRNMVGNMNWKTYPEDMLFWFVMRGFTKQELPDVRYLTTGFEVEETDDHLIKSNTDIPRCATMTL